MSSAKSPTKFVDDDRFDGLYLQVADAAKGIEPLLDTVFSFLRRKTDFFAGPPGSDMGTEAAVQKVNDVLMKHAQLYEKENNLKKKSPKKATPTTNKKAKKEEPAAADVIEMGNDGGFDLTKADAAPAANETEQKEPTKATSPIKTDTPTKEAETDATKDDTDKNDTDNKDGDTTTTDPSWGNGGTVEGKYVWTQILSEVTVTVPLPDNTRGRDLNVTISRKHLKVGLKGAAEGGGVKWLVDDDLCKPIVMDDSFWTVEDGNRLVINLQKLNAMEWWDSVCASDLPKINIQKIQPENSSLNDLDGETRKTVEKMMFDQRQKAMGLPTADEQNKQEMIEKFMKQHPEMDFSQAKIN